MTIVRRRRHEAGFHRGFRLRLPDAAKPGLRPGFAVACLDYGLRPGGGSGRVGDPAFTLVLIFILVFLLSDLTLNIERRRRVLGFEADNASRLFMR
jgi:hypothetical protein